MAPESGSNLRLEIGHVLFIDLVGYSKLLIEQQKERLHRLTEAVLATPQVRESPNEQLVRLPTGDGMALVFRNSAEEPRSAQTSPARESTGATSDRLPHRGPNAKRAQGRSQSERNYGPDSCHPG